MPYKDPEKQKIAQKAWYDKNKDLTRSRSKTFREKNKQVVREIKESSPCVDCGISYPYFIMQFDHLDSNDKSDNINKLLTKTSLARVLEEISKCDLLCANCHAMRTWKRQHKIDI